MIKDFNKNLERLQGTMFSYALQLTSDREKAQDLTQETSLRALINAEKFVTDTSFKGWLSTMMKNIYINEYRREKRNPLARLDDVLDFQAEPMSSEEVSGRCDASLVMEAIEELAEVKRVPIAMFMKGYSYNDIAERTGTPIGSVKSRIFYAREELKKKLKLNE